MPAVPKVNWSKLTAPLRPETVAAIAAFRGRNVELLKQIETLQAQDVTLDFAGFRNRIADSKVVDDAEKVLSSFKPKTFDTSKQIAELNKGEQLAVSTSLSKNGVGNSRDERQMRGTRTRG